MTKEVEFYFDFGSPYTYLAYHELPKLAARHGASVAWRPILLGGVFQATGNHSPATIPLKGAHMQVDLLRWAQKFDVAFRMNPYFPINTLTLMRGAVGMQRKGEADFTRYLATVFHAMFEEPKNLGDPKELAFVLGAAGFDGAEFMAMVSDAAVKEALKTDTVAAVARGVFGAPTFFVGDQMFWGQDRLGFVEEALA